MLIDDIEIWKQVVELSRYRLENKQFGCFAVVFVFEAIRNKRG